MKYSNANQPPRCETCEAWQRTHDHSGVCSKMHVAVLQGCAAPRVSNNQPIDLAPPYLPAETSPRFGCVFHTDYAATFTESSA